MIEALLIIGIIFWLLGKLLVWLFNAILGILPIHVAESIRQWTRFSFAIIIILMIISFLGG